MKVLKIKTVKHSGLGNPLHSQVINILNKFGLGSELDKWCAENKVSYDHNKNTGMVRINGESQYSFSCSLLFA